VRQRAEVGHFISAVDHLTALRARGTFLQRVLTETFRDVDIALLPVLADPLPSIAELDIGEGPQVQAVMGRVVKYTRPINYLGLPTLSLPIARAGGLPNGVQLIARPYAEARLLALGQAYQRLVPAEIARPLAAVELAGAHRPA
jgi:aspartyl-tRNA(Asn)/glutamyl-tRNA(Gln) amidotransferase subunit A